MLNERYQISAMPVGGGERIQGYYCYVGWTRQQKHYIVPEYASDFYGKEVDTTTIEPVRVKPIIETTDEDGVEYEFNHYLCPNCKNIIHQHYRKSKEPMRYKQNYCVDCGMALLWED